MSYYDMDHADWASRNNCGIKRGKPKKDRYGIVIGPHACPDQLSQFQAQVMDILGIVGGGVHNAPINWDTLDWGNALYLSVTWRGDLASFDGSALTNLVVLCHIACIRVDISPAGPRHIRIMFHPREREGGMGTRHPTMEEAVARIEAALPSDHRIRQPRTKQKDAT